MHDGYGVGLVFDLINDIIRTIVLFGSTILKNIHTYFSEIDYNSIGFDIINKYSTMKQTVVSTYNNNIDKNSILNISLEYSLYFIEYVKSFIYDYRVEPFNNNWISISYVDQTENDKKTLSFIFDETYDELDTIHFFKDNIVNDYCDDFNAWYNTAKAILLKDRKVFDCLISMRIENKYIYKVCNIEEEAFDELPFELSKVKFLSIEYTHPELDKPIVIEVDKNAYLIGNEILSCTFVKRALEYSCNIKNFDTDYVLKIMDNDLKTFELKSNEYIKLEKDSYKIIQKKCAIVQQHEEDEDEDEEDYQNEEDDFMETDFVDSHEVVDK
jgi:hypothetical protein